jgi:hypothetical protein
MPKAAQLASPLKSFNIPIVSWCPTELQFKKFQDNARIVYLTPVPILIKGSQWYRVSAYSLNHIFLGQFLLPFKYHALWRRLVYGALFQENMYSAWIKRTKRFKATRLTAVQQQEIRLKDMAGVRLVQYLLYRRLVLKELLNLRFDNNDPLVHSLIEFGIRESRDWMFEAFHNAKKKGASYLRLDPTHEGNKKEFR